MNATVEVKFGATGVADAGARLRVEGPARLRHLMAATQGVPVQAGDEQLR